MEKLKPRYLGPYRIIERIGAVAYRLELPQELSDIHNVFHVSVLRKVVREPELILQQPPEDVSRNLTAQSKPVKVSEIKDMDVQGKVTTMIRVSWERDGICEETWEPESQMRSFYPELF